MNNLRKLPVISMVTAILLCTCIASSVAEVLSFSPGVNMDNVSTAFLQEHPNVELITDGILGASGYNEGCHRKYSPDWQVSHVAILR